jgi:fructose-1,6-bisphosphatase/sedoheptulose 1,7-bisphosphatase-like protein
MDSIQVRHQIVVKVIVTEEFLKGYVLELNNNLTQMKQQLAQLETQQDKNSQLVTLDIQRHKKMLHETEKRIKEAKGLTIGDLFTQGSVEGLSTVSVGDHLYKSISSLHVILKDGIVQEVKRSE